MGFSPFSRCDVTFSSTTIASSTTMPMAIARALMEMMFRVLFVAKRYSSEARRAIGILRTTMSVPLSLPRKRNTTSMTTRKVMMMVSLRDWIVRMISSELSTTWVICMSEGRLREIFFISSLIFRITSTVL